MTAKTLAKRIMAQRLDQGQAYVDKMRTQHGDQLVDEAIAYISTVAREARYGSDNRSRK